MSKTLCYEYEFDITTSEGRLDASYAIDHANEMMWLFDSPTFRMTIESDGNKLIIRSDRDLNEKPDEWIILD
jgi:hypothetical protein